MSLTKNYPPKKLPISYVVEQYDINILIFISYLSLNYVIPVYAGKKSKVLLRSRSI